MIATNLDEKQQLFITKSTNSLIYHLQLEGTPTVSIFDSTAIPIFINVGVPLLKIEKNVILRNFLIESDEDVTLNIGGNDYVLEKGRHYFPEVLHAYHECKPVSWSINTRISNLCKTEDVFNGNYSSHIFYMCTTLKYNHSDVLCFFHEKMIYFTYSDSGEDAKNLDKSFYINNMPNTSLTHDDNIKKYIPYLSHFAKYPNVVIFDSTYIPEFTQNPILSDISTEIELYHFLIESDEDVTLNIGGNDYVLEKGRHYFPWGLHKCMRCKLVSWSINTRIYNLCHPRVGYTFFDSNIYICKTLSKKNLSDYYCNDCITICYNGMLMSVSK